MRPFVFNTEERIKKGLAGGSWPSHSTSEKSIQAVREYEKERNSINLRSAITTSPTIPEALKTAYQVVMAVSNDPYCSLARKSRSDNFGLECEKLMMEREKKKKKALIISY